MTALVLGLDLGTSAVKAALVDASGTVRGAGRQAYPTRHPAPGFSEQSPPDWITAATEAIRQAVAPCPAPVAAIGLAGHMSAPVLIDRDGTALAACHTLTDSRAETPPADVRQEIARRTGNLCAAHFTLPKLLWWQRHHPDILRRTRHVLAPKDYLAAWLTGEVASEPTDSGNMLLLDPLTRRWMPDLARAAGLDPALLPPLAEPGTLLGSLRPECAEQLGLPQNIPVATGASDMAAALLGTDIAGDERAGREIAVTIGTSATVIAAVDRLDASLAGRLTFHPGTAPGSLFALGSHFNGGACLDWLAGILGPDRLRAASDAAADIPLGADGLLFLPYLLGAGSPDFDPHARGAFLGLAATHGPAHLLRAVIEGITMDLCLSLDLLDRDLEATLVLAGGGANLAIWPQTLADLAQRPVRPAACPDASAMGAARLAAMCLGWPRPTAGARGPTRHPAACSAATTLRQNFARARTR